jgi:predicted RND superfamily exporter protein
LFHGCMYNWGQLVQETNVLARNGIIEIMYFPVSSRVQYDSPYDDLDAEWHLIEKWMSDDRQQAPEGVKNAYLSSEDFWWYDTNGKMLSAAYSSAAITLAAAAVVILCTSRSLALTLFGTLTIGYVLTTVTATCVAMGWTLGFLEAICFAILIGVSCDFVIHFSHAYAFHKGDVSRGERTKHALIEMGPSILAGAFTTMAGAAIMVFTQITFFQKFAVILFLTVIQGTVGSFVVFLSMTDCLGPSNPTALVDTALSKCSKKGESKDVSNVEPTEIPEETEEN